MSEFLDNFRQRTSSFDRHILSKGRAHLSRLFHRKSEASEEIRRSHSADSDVTHHHQTVTMPPRRRFARIVRDEEAEEAEETENPHVVRQYSAEYKRKHCLQHTKSLEETGVGHLPYEVTGHTILKRQAASESGTGSTLENARHASFKEEVEIIEFDKKDKIKRHQCLTHSERLHDEDDLEDDPKTVRMQFSMADDIEGVTVSYEEALLQAYHPSGVGISKSDHETGEANSKAVRFDLLPSDSLEAECDQPSSQP